jgi:hypothetical protein
LLIIQQHTEQSGVQYALSKPELVTVKSESLVCLAGAR